MKTLYNQAWGTILALVHRLAQDVTLADTELVGVLSVDYDPTGKRGSGWVCDKLNVDIRDFPWDDLPELLLRVEEAPGCCHLAFLVLRAQYHPILTRFVQQFPQQEQRHDIFAYDQPDVDALLATYPRLRKLYALLPPV